MYGSQYPNSAFGVSLDNVVALNGITRLPALQTIVFASCFGNEGTLIPQGALATIPNSNDVYACFEDALISITRSDFINVSVGALAGQIYTITLDSVPYISSFLAFLY